MRNLLVMLMVGFLGLTLLIEDAEARRFGGGKSLGKQSPSYSRQATPPQQSQQATAARQQAGQPAAATSGARRWLGPLAGLAAGGLLAAMLFGDGFEGFQLLDFLLLAGLAFLGFKLFKAMRAKSAAAGGQPRYAPAGSSPGSANFETPEIGSGLKGAQAPSPSSVPAWFNEEEFLRAAKTHFIRLQAAWDSGDMEDIREYATPELFTELSLEREQLKSEEQFTEVVSLNAELLDVVTQGDQVTASVRYSGLIREARDAEPNAFSEIWHIQRALDDPQANWYVAGIQQEDLPQ